VQRNHHWLSIKFNEDTFDIKEDTIQYVFDIKDHTIFVLKNTTIDITWKIAEQRLYYHMRVIVQGRPPRAFNYV